MRANLEIQHIQHVTLSHFATMPAPSPHLGLDSWKKSLGVLHCSALEIYVATESFATKPKKTEHITNTSTTQKSEDLRNYKSKTSQ